MDSELVTEEITTYCATQQIHILPCVPHEHATLGDIERDNRTVRETIIKCIASKTHLNSKYWGMCLHDVLFKRTLCHIQTTQPQMHTACGMGNNTT